MSYRSPTSRLDSVRSGLVAQRAILQAAEAEGTVDESVPTSIGELASELHRLIPSGVPRFDATAHTAGFEGLRRRYRVPTLLAFVEGCLAVGEGEVAAKSGLPSVDLSFVADALLRRILERDLQELHRAHESGCWKGVILLAGGIIEAALQHAVGKQGRVSGGEEPTFRDWIRMARERGLVSAGGRQLADAARCYRNAIHTEVELREGFSVDRDKAQLQVEMLATVCSELKSRMQPKG